MLVMDQSLGQFGSSESKDNAKVLTREKNDGEKLHRCKQCNYASAQAANLGRHLKTHGRDKSNKCNQCTIG